MSPLTAALMSAVPPERAGSGSAMNDATRELGAALGVAVLGVNTSERKANAAKEYMAKQKYTYGCLLSGDDLAQAYGISGLPTLVLIGKDGKIVLTEGGMSSESGAAPRKAIDAALAK